LARSRRPRRLRCQAKNAAEIISAAASEVTDSIPPGLNSTRRICSNRKSNAGNAQLLGTTAQCLTEG
jgi:hypothetical protein